MNGEIEPTEQQAPVNERAAYLAELTERAARVANEIYELSKTAGVEEPYVSIYRGYRDPSIYVSAGNGSAFDAPSVEGVLELISKYDPDAERKKRIQKLKDEVAMLEAAQ